MIGLTEKTLISFKRWMSNERKSQLTVRQYSFFASLFIDFIKKEINEINEEDIERFKQFLVVEKKYSKSSQYLCIKALRLLYKSYHIQPPYNLTSPKRPRSVPKYLTEHETSRLLSFASRNPKTLAIISTLAYTGLRVSELCSLNIEDVDLEEKVMRVRHGKGDKDRIVIMSDECADSIEKYMKSRVLVRTDSEALFLSRKTSRYDPTSIQRLVKKIAKESGVIKNVTPHVLRHTFATSIMRNGANLRFIQEILGHSSISTTQIYVHLDDGAMRQMYQKHKPVYRSR
ncbi:MAG: site-specific tyrosine recombinase/integron integrase [Thermoplasmataceae archaeon]|jgi:integrase/recombinase XerD